MTDIHAKMVAQCCTTGEVIHFITDVLSDGDGSNKEDVLQGEGNFKVDPDSDSGSDSDSDYPEENVEEMKGPSTFMGRGCGCGRKMQRGSGCGGARGPGHHPHGADGELIRGSRMSTSLMLLTVRFFT